MMRACAGACGIGEPSSTTLTCRRMFFGGAALAVNALAACGGVPIATETAGTPLATPAASSVPMVAATPPLLVFAGASIAAGPGVPPTDAFPARTIVLLSPVAYDAVDVAVSGETVRTWDTTASAAIDPRYAASRATNIVVFYAGLNDLHAGASIGETVARIVAFGQGRRHAGFQVVIGTLLPSTVHLEQGREYEALG